MAGDRDPAALRRPAQLRSCSRRIASSLGSDRPRDCLQPLIVAAADASTRATTARRPTSWPRRLGLAARRRVRRGRLDARRRARAAAEGAPAGTLVVADAQTAGRGRSGRTWTSERGAGVWLTLIERPRDVDALDVLSLRVGLALAPALDRVRRRARFGSSGRTICTSATRKLGGHSGRGALAG